MAFTTTLYNHTVKKLLGGEIDFTALKVMLLDVNAIFDATDTTLVNVLAGAATEVSGNGWTAGGELLSGVVSNIATTNDGKIIATDLRVRATGGPIAAYACVVYDDADSGDAPILFIDFGGVLSAGDGTDMLIPASLGIITGTY